MAAITMIEYRSKLPSSGWHGGRLNHVFHGLLPSGVKMRHAWDVTECSLFAMLYDAMESLLAATHRGIPQSVEGIVHTILQHGNTQHILRIVHKLGIKSPKIEPLFIRVANVKNMPGHFMHHVTSAIVFKRIFCFAQLVAFENAFIGRPFTPLQTPVRDPAIE
jgi:hypothetical protein